MTAAAALTGTGRGATAGATAGTTAWIAALALSGLAAARLLATDTSFLPIAPATILIFFAGYWMVTSRSQAGLTRLSPLSWTLFMFFIQLVVGPLLLLLGGPARGTLPRLPQDVSMNAALAVSTAAFIGFTGGFAIFYSRRKGHLPGNQPTAGFTRPSLGLGLGFLAAGAIGFYLYARTVPLAAVLTNPELVRQLEQTRDTGLAAAAATFLRPFLSTALVVFWIAAIRSPRLQILPVKLMASAATAAVLVLIMSTYSLNRAAFMVPLVALTAVLTQRHRVPVWPFWIIGMIGILPLWVLGTYRSQGRSAADFVSLSEAFLNGNPARQLSEGIQIYGGGPQFLGFLIEQRTDQPLLWGSSLVSSVMTPVPVLGRDFRDSSGTALYNQMIYGSASKVDQVVPFAGELYMNFQLPGVLAGFLLVGWAISWMEMKFHTCRSDLDLYFYQFAGMWISFLVAGSLAVVIQISLYLSLPLHCWIVLRWLSLRGGSARLPSPAFPPRILPAQRWRETQTAS